MEEIQWGGKGVGSEGVVWDVSVVMGVEYDTTLEEVDPLQVMPELSFCLV